MILSCLTGGRAPFPWMRRARAIADRKTGIGCDQIIMLQKSDIADVRMLVWNSGGGQVESCGNAARCIADMLFDENKTTSATIDTLGGFLVARKAGDKMVTIDNGVPRFDWKDIPLSEPFHDTRHIELQVGPIDAPAHSFALGGECGQSALHFLG